MRRDYNLLNRIIEVKTYDVAALVTDGQLTLTTARIRVCGNFASLSITGTANATQAAGESKVQVTLDKRIRPNGNVAVNSGTVGVVSGKGELITSNGAINFIPDKNVAIGNTIRMYSFYLLNNPYNGEGGTPI